MVNPTMTRMSVNAQQSHVRREARRGRMPEYSRHARARLQERLFVRAGDILISTGQRLQARYKPAAQPCCEACN
jgi:hypothetical protein